MHDAFVHQRLFVIFDVIRKEPQDVIQRRIKLFVFFAEKELYASNEIIQHIS